MTGSGWTPSKVASFRKAFFDFLKCVLIDSKEKGGDYCLADGVYDAQMRLIDGVLSGLALDKHDVKCLKSRQLGISTISEALFVFWVGMFTGIQSAVIFDTAGHLKEARLRIKNLIKRLPKSLHFPIIMEDSRDILVLSNGSTIRWLAAGVRETESSGGLGRSSGLNVIWASEVSSWKNEEGIVSLKETLSETFENRLFLYESTARGYNAWRDMWMDAKNDDLGQTAIFIGWWAHPLHIIKRNDGRFERYGTLEPTKKEQEIIAKVESEYGHKITQEQLAWHRYKIDPNRELEDGEKKSSQFKQQEQPSTEEEAFTQAGSSFFDHVALNEHSIRLQKFARSRNYRYTFGSEFHETQILPAMHYREIELRVWEPPQANVEYIVAADPAFGRNPDNDRSAAQVLACYADCIEQVAEYACATVNTDQFAWVIASIAAYYKRVVTIIELDGPGEAVWKQYHELPRILRAPYMSGPVQERGLTDVFNNVRDYIFRRSDSLGGSGALHWKTGNRKESIMEKLRALVQTGTIIIKSLDTIEEMRTIARDGASIEAPSHKHDDRTLALAIAARAWEDEVRPGLVSRGRTIAAITDARQMTTQGRMQIFMQNTIQDMFKKNERRAVLDARTQRLAANSRPHSKRW